MPVPSREHLDEPSLASALALEQGTEQATSA